MRHINGNLVLHRRGAGRREARERTGKAKPCDEGGNAGTGGGMEEGRRKGLGRRGGSRGVRERSKGTGGGGGGLPCPASNAYLLLASC